MAEYATTKYWNERYQTDTEVFEWYLPYEAVAGILSQHITTISETLVIGCGNSTLSEEIHDNLSKEVTSMDFSDVVIDQMKQKYRLKPSLKFVTADIEQLDPDIFTASRFDVVVDKGTLDSILCGDNAEQAVRAAIREIHRVLRPGGVFLYITCASPDDRAEFFDSKDGSWRAATPLVVSRPPPGPGEEHRRDGGANSGVHYLLMMTKRSHKALPT